MTDVIDLNEYRMTVLERRIAAMEKPTGPDESERHAPMSGGGPLTWEEVLPRPCCPVCNCRIEASALLARALELNARGPHVTRCRVFESLVREVRRDAHTVAAVLEGVCVDCESKEVERRVQADLASLQDEQERRSLRHRQKRASAGSEELERDTPSSTVQVPRAEIATVARACRAGVTAFMDTACASLRRTIGYASEVEAWAIGATANLPASVARYWKFASVCAEGGCECADGVDECAHCAAGPVLCEEYWGEFDIELKVCELMRIAAGGANVDESPSDLLGSMAYGIDAANLSDAVDQAVDASLARDRANKKRQARAAAKRGNHG